MVLYVAHYQIEIMYIYNRVRVVLSPSRLWVRGGEGNLKKSNQKREKKKKNAEVGEKKMLKSMVLGENGQALLFPR